MNLMFGQIREDILAHPDLTPAAKLIWAALWMHWLQRENCWPTQETLANKTALSRKTASEAISCLIELHLITTKRSRYGLCYTKGPAYIDGIGRPFSDVTNLPISDSRCNNFTHEMSKKVTSDVTNLHIEENQEENKEEKTTSLARNGKSNGHPKRTTWKDGPNATAIEEFIDFFLTTHPKPAKLTPASRDACGKVVDEMIRLDGVDPTEARHWIGWACHDSFWQSNLLSLASLRKPGKSGAMKWETVCAKYEQSKNGSSVDSMGLTQADYDQVIAASMARREKRLNHSNHQPIGRK